MTLVLVEDSRRVRTLTLNRPDKLNACNEALLDALGDELERAATDKADNRWAREVAETTGS